MVLVLAQIIRRMNHHNYIDDDDDDNTMNVALCNETQKTKRNGTNRSSLASFNIFLLHYRNSTLSGSSSLGSSLDLFPGSLNQQHPSEQKGFTRYQENRQAIYTRPGEFLRSRFFFQEI